MQNTFGHLYQMSSTTNYYTLDSVKASSYSTIVKNKFIIFVAVMEQI